MIRDGKGAKDRVTMLPLELVPPLRAHLDDVRAAHEADLHDGFGHVWMPDALARKYPRASREWAWVMITLAVIGIIYGALVAMVQPDVNRLVAYSSVSHMGFVMLGLSSMNVTGFNGALLEMFNHGIITGGISISLT